jgi:hypothetical protein
VRTPPDDFGFSRTPLRASWQSTVSFPPENAKPVDGEPCRFSPAQPEHGTRPHHWRLILVEDFGQPL